MTSNTIVYFKTVNQHSKNNQANWGLNSLFSPYMAELFTPKLAAKSYYAGTNSRRNAITLGTRRARFSAVAVHPVPDPGAIATE